MNVKIKIEPQENENFYYRLFNLIDEAIQICELVFDEKGEPIDVFILDVNRAYEKHSGVKREQVRGWYIKEVLPIVEQIWLERYAEIVQSGMGTHFKEYNASLKKWFEVSASPMGGNRFIAVFKDITERTKELENTYSLLKESEARLEEAQKIANIGSWEWNIETKKFYWSNEAYRILGHNSREFEITYHMFLNSIHHDDREYVNKAIIEAFNMKAFETDFRVISHDGQERYVFVKGGVVYGEKNIPIRVRGIIQDVTDRKQMEKLVYKTNIARKKEIHHRIKNNLQVISSLLDLQAEKFSSKKSIKVSEVLEAFKESQDRVISMALIHEELHNGGDNDNINMSRYIEELTDNLFLTYMLGNENTKLYKEIEEDIFFNTDISVPIGLMINEMISNSFKYAFVGRNNGEIRIKLHREGKRESIKEDCKSTIFVLSVSDNGIGISEDIDIENLDSLGLQLVTTLVEQLDGELELRRDNGTEFIIWFTVEEENKASVPTIVQSFSDDKTQQLTLQRFFYLS